MRMDDSRQSLVEHLDDLRQAILTSLAALLAAALAGYFMAPEVMGYLKRLLPVPNLVFFGPFDGFYLQIRMAVTLGMIMAFPVFVASTVWFIGPGLTVREKRVALYGGAAALALFIGGAAYALTITLPLLLAFLMTFSTPEMLPVVAGEDFMTFVLSFLIYSGLVFELPLFIFLLLYLDILSPRLINLHRKACFACLLSLTLFFAPGGDLLTQVLMALPLYVLFELAVVTAKYTPKYMSKIRGDYNV